MKSTLNDMHEPADICRENGWLPGAKLIGDEGYGPTVICITAIGEKNILAKEVSHNGQPRDGYETSWVLYSRDWTEIK